MTGKLWWPRLPPSICACKRERDIKGKKGREKNWERNRVRPSAVLTWPGYTHASLSLFLFPSLTLSSNKHRARGSLNRGLLEPNQNSTSALSDTMPTERAFSVGTLRGTAEITQHSLVSEVKPTKTSVDGAAPASHRCLSVCSCSSVKQVTQIKSHLKHVNIHRDAETHHGLENATKW